MIDRSENERKIALRRCRKTCVTCGGALDGHANRKYCSPYCLSTSKIRRASKDKFYNKHGGPAAYMHSTREDFWARAKRWAAYIARAYGITVEDFAWMWYAQDGKCAICRRPLRDGGGGLNIDHEHKKGGKVRGLLCTFCNWKVLGPIERGGRARLIDAVRYLGWGRIVD